MLVPNQKVIIKWNNANRKHYEKFGYLFTNSNDEFEININHISKGSRAIVKFECDWCQEEFDRSYRTGIRAKNQFCTHECSVKYSSKTKLESRPWKKCEWCNEEYQTEHYNEETSRFCSRECLAKWQSVAFKGKGSSRYVERVTVKCDWCNEILERTPYQLKNRTYNFCNRDCQRKWHKEVFVKSEEFLENAKNVMITNLTEGKISFTQSKPQVIINELLKNKGLKFLNEVSVGDFSFDVYLDEFDLFIEVNGGFWHCDSRVYDEINYDIQLNRIISDKRKRTFLKNKLNKNILYLWEFDIETNLELCMKLIIKYIESDGKLKNYHSCNYCIDENGDINLETEIIKPYMDWGAKDLAEITDLSTRENVNRYQPEKHITFNCEYCGEEKTQYVGTYIRAKNHFCSVLCKNLSQQIGNETDKLVFIHQCDNCNENLEIPNHRHLKIIGGEQRNIFCSRECKAEWQSKNNIGENNPLYSQIDKICERCGEKYSIPFSQKDRNKYCSAECRQKASRNRIVVKCLNCDEDVEKTPTNINKNKTGEYFCSHVCHNKYKRKSNLEVRQCEYCMDKFETKKKSTQRFCCISCRNKGIALEKK